MSVSPEELAEIILDVERRATAKLAASASATRLLIDLLVNESKLGPDARDRVCAAMRDQASHISATDKEIADAYKQFADFMEA